VQMVEIVNFLLMTNVVIDAGVAFTKRNDVLFPFANVVLFRVGRGVVHGSHPPVPFRGDRGRIEVVNVTWLDPTVLAEGVIDPVFVITISSSVTSHVSAEFEGIVPISVHVLEEAFPSSSVFQSSLKITDDPIHHGDDKFEYYFHRGELFSTY